MRPILYLHERNRWHITVAFLALTVIFAVFILPYEEALLAEAAGNQIAPDLRIFYMPKDLQTIAGRFSEAGRQQYIISRLRFDIAWPLVYGGTFFTLSSHCIKYIKQGHAFLVFPVLAVLFDLTENTAVSIYFHNYPTHNILIASIAGLSTFLKWLSLIASFSMLVTLAAIALRKWRVERAFRQ